MMQHLVLIGLLLCVPPGPARHTHDALYDWSPVRLLVPVAYKWFRSGSPALYHTDGPYSHIPSAEFIYDAELNKPTSVKKDLSHSPVAAVTPRQDDVAPLFHAGDSPPQHSGESLDDAAYSASSSYLQGEPREESARVVLLPRTLLSRLVRLLVSPTGRRPHSRDDVMLSSTYSI